MDETQKILAALGTQVAEGVAKYEKIEKEAVAVLTRGGRVAMERNMTARQLRTILQIAHHIVGYHDPENPRLLRLQTHAAAGCRPAAGLR